MGVLVVVDGLVVGGLVVGGLVVVVGGLVVGRLVVGGSVVGGLVVGGVVEGLGGSVLVISLGVVDEGGVAVAIKSTLSTKSGSALLLMHKLSSMDLLNLAQSRCSGHEILVLRVSMMSLQPLLALSQVSRHGVTTYFRGRVGWHCGK